MTQGPLRTGRLRHLQPRRAPVSRPGNYPTAITPTLKSEEPVTFRGGINAGTSYTWGFTAFYNSGNDHISTSAHAGSTQSYAGSNLTFVREWHQGERDMQLHSLPSGNTVENEVYTALTPPYREIKSDPGYSSIDNGDDICGRGRTSPYDCGHINSVVNEQAGQAEAGGSASHALRYDDLPRDEGDSGSPLYYGTAALGNHDGGNSTIEIGISTTYNFGTISAVRTK